MDKNEHTVGSKHIEMKQRGPIGRGPTEGMGTGKKANDFKKNIRQLLSYIKAYMPMIILSMVLALAGSVFNVIGPDKLSDIANLIQEGIVTGIDVNAVQKIVLVLVVLYGLGLIFNYFQGFITVTVSQRLTKKMRTELSRKINHMPLKYFDATSYGNVLSRVTNDVDTIGQTLNNSLGTLVSALATFVGALIMMLYTNWIMTITGIVATLIGFSLMTVIMKHSQKYFVAQQAELGQINGHIEETYAGHNVVKVYNGEKAAKEVFHGINGRLYTNAWKSQFMSGLMMPVMMFIGNFGYVAVCIVGALLVNQHVITIGTIVAFMVYIRLFTQPLSQLAQAATNLQSAAAASERVFEFLGEEELVDESDKTMKLDNAKGDVEFKHVRFGYNEDHMIIKDFSMKAEAGQKIAIVGPTGAGKTTLVNLLMRFYELNGGEIYIDGTPISQLTRENVHKLFCMVLQDTWLFEGTIRENIVFSKEHVTDEQVEAACRAVGLHSFLKTLPQGYDTVLDDKANLSAGQKQLITIARAMIEDAPMLILDEATSSVDTRTELLIQQAMDRLTVGKTSFVIAHRLSTIKNADLILVMKDGNIIETGNHEELLGKNGFYADLYNSQFEHVS
ncbi:MULTISPECIES: ABC transporter ATP-binding protein [Paenibacillus]|jgi:ATP-binding cassette subfamily B multidrug efflux pump|uniref:Lipid A export ATP-binding/permease protein MsbA n=2 Tax=Paenibacillus polymyxa TaxID=1406 RepID=A0A378XXT4_PAEPO|nr:MULTISPECIES: ABC transporter ATP-binding protein [Paenibacillus]MDP9679211.1 ATP-binding cassette subfamily B protein [Paenibacillus jamilae]KAF6582931.1 ABC transporter ATP-binding protein [Paenibacillus sp. EKM211P]KAF6614609.1 ABC transporter ATP-binding protein [Paenibacillus sp. EKM101P]KAF6617426.1 ABC transporter ATP-binding protein [Paenibacillus sp. EKM102P]KAF6625597.1 ABC transporter ATP-binding protein [Paenibacillus sp. EKM10P]